MAISHSALLLFSLNYCLDDELLSVLSWNIFWTIKQIYFGQESKYIWTRKQIHMCIYFGQWNKYIPDKKAGHDSVLFLLPNNIGGATLRLHPGDFMIFKKFNNIIYLNRFNMFFVICTLDWPLFAGRSLSQEIPSCFHRSLADYDQSIIYL